MSDLIDAFDNFISATYDENLLILSYNPMMTIALTAEILKRISDSRRRFLDKCIVMVDALLNLGKYYNSKIVEPDYYEQLITERDFLGRTVLAIICECQF